MHILINSGISDSGQKHQQLKTNPAAVRSVLNKWTRSAPGKESFYLEQLLFLRDFVVDLPASRAGNGTSRHLLERLETARTSKVTTRKRTRASFP